MIFSTPFYCGLVYSSQIPGELFGGKHPALIDQDTSLKANQISKQNSISGVPKKMNIDELPLKIFMKDFATKSLFTGYHNKKKNLFYYKSIDKGTKSNISAKYLNYQFEKVLKSVEFDRKSIEQLKSLVCKKLENHIEVNLTDEIVNRKEFLNL
jgi:hypothetical protein